MKLNIYPLIEISELSKEEKIDISLSEFNNEIIIPIVEVALWRLTKKIKDIRAKNIFIFELIRLVKTNGIRKKVIAKKWNNVAIRTKK